MEPVVAIAAGVLFAAGIYLLLRRSLAKLLLGLALLTNGANLAVLAGGGVRRGAPPLIDPLDAGARLADPLPQALILTAIVISFGVLAFAVALLYRAYQAVGDDDLDRLKTTDGVERPTRAAPEMPPDEVVAGAPEDAQVPAKVTS